MPALNHFGFRQWVGLIGKIGGHHLCLDGPWDKLRLPGRSLAQSRAPSIWVSPSIPALALVYAAM